MRLRRCIRAPALADSASRASLGGIVMLKLGAQWQWQAAAAHAGGKLAGGASWAVRCATVHSGPRFSIRSMVPHAKVPPLAPMALHFGREMNLN